MTSKGSTGAAAQSRRAAQSPIAEPPSMDFLSSLNPEQREAVLHTDGTVADPGWGGVREDARHCLSHRVSDRRTLARPFEVLAVTFTNKAAEEMRERVGKLIGDDAGDVWISTFHSLCARLLRREAPAIGLSRDFVIYDSSDQVSAVKQVMRELQIDDKIIQPRQVLGRISQAKNRMEAPDKVGNGELSRRADREDLRRVREGARARQRARLRRPAAQDRGTVRARPAATQVPAPVPVRDGR